MNANSLFTVWPYAAGTTLLVGMIVRLVMIQAHITAVGPPHSIKDRSIASNILIVMLGLLLVVHSLGSIFPQFFFRWSRVPARLYFFEIAAFLVGMLALGSFISVIWRSLSHTHSGTSIISWLGQMVFLSLLLVCLASGLLMAASYRWSSVWGAMTLMPYFVSVVSGKPTASLVTGLPFLARLHVFVTWAAMASFPFSQTAEDISAALFRSLGGTIAPSVDWISGHYRAGQHWLQRHNPAAWILRDEED